jgi:hypothetical protein
MHWMDFRNSNTYSMGHVTEEQIKGEARFLALQLVTKQWANTVYEPGNASRYDIYIVDVRDGYHLVALPEWHSSYKFNLKSWLHPEYIAEKLSVSEADAACVAELLMATGEVLP